MSSIRDVLRKSIQSKHESLKRSRRLVASNAGRCTPRRCPHPPQSTKKSPSFVNAYEASATWGLHRGEGDLPRTAYPADRSHPLDAGLDTRESSLLLDSGSRLDISHPNSKGGYPNSQQPTPAALLEQIAEIDHGIEELSDQPKWESHEVSCPSSDSDLDAPLSPVSPIKNKGRPHTHSADLSHTCSPPHPDAQPQHIPSLLSFNSTIGSSPKATYHDAHNMDQNPSMPSTPDGLKASSSSRTAAISTSQGIQMLLSSSRTSLSVAIGAVLFGAVMGMLMPGWAHYQQARAIGGFPGSSYEVGGAKQLLGWNGPRTQGPRSVHVGSGGGNSPTEASRPVRLIAVVPAGEPSPYKATWDEVMLHVAQRLEWNNPDFKLEVFMERTLTQTGSEEHKRFMQAARTAEVFVGVQVTDPVAVKAVQSAVSSIPTHVFFESSSSLHSSAMLDGYAPQLQLDPIRNLLEALPWTKAAQAKKVNDILQELYGRHTSDDLLFVFLVLINEYITKVPEVANTAKGMDFEGLQCIGRHCSQQVVECLSDPNCKTALDCLQACSFNDQVCQYRCIVSYESKPLEQFSLCILQLHNCRNLKAEMPMRPDPAPMTAFRGSPLTHEAAEDMFVGWMGEKPYSWLVAGGKNPAYDYFPCQHQLYYKGKGKGVLWYEPVFKAITLDGREVWRRRRYRVRRGKVPGTFHYSVLDNGVTSNEFWRILDCADDYSFCLFYYSGAASAAGLSYSGAVLATPDGKWPDQHTARIQSALEPAGIKMWELSRVDNSMCHGAPLEKAGGATPALAV